MDFGSDYILTTALDPAVDYEEIEIEVPRAGVAVQARSRSSFLSVKASKSGGNEGMCLLEILDT